MIFFAFLVFARANNCFKFQGDLAKDAPSVTYNVGESIALSWTPDPFFCKATDKSVVRIELWESDFFGDDEIAKVADAVVGEENPFLWAVPVDLTDILKKGGESEEDAEFYFRIIDVNDGGLRGESRTFKISSKQAFLSISGPFTHSFSTGNTVEFDVLSKLLPQRQIRCDLKKRYWLELWGNYTVTKVIEFQTSAAPGLSKRVVPFVIGPEIKTGSDHFIQCETTDNIRPKKTSFTSAEHWFHIEQIKTAIELTSPKAGALFKAGTTIPVRWVSNDIGLAADDTFSVALYRVIAPRGPNTAIESLEWQTASGQAPLVSSGRFDVPISKSYERLSDAQKAFTGRTNSFFVRLTLKSKPQFKVQSRLFEFENAERVCTLDTPAIDGFMTFEIVNNFAFSCKGYKVGEKGSFALVKIDGTESVRLPIDNAQHELLSGPRMQFMPTASVQGWVYRAEVDDGDNKQLSHIFLGKQNYDNQCVVSGMVASCQGVPFLAATFEQQQTLVSLDVEWSGPNCGSAAGQLTLTAKWHRGTNSPVMVTESIARVVDNGETTQSLLGTDCANCLDVQFRFVEYPNDRTSLSFTLLLALPAQSAAALDLGIIRYSTLEGCKDPNTVLNTDNTPMPPVVVTREDPTTVGTDPKSVGEDPSAPSTEPSTEPMTDAAALTMLSTHVVIAAILTNE